MTELNRLLNSIYIVLQAFYRFSGYSNIEEDRFVHYEENQTSLFIQPLD
jgi:hypothetical protein